MRLLVLGAIAIASLWGCQTWQERAQPFQPMEATTITVETKPDRPQTFIEALRESCMTYGTFILDYQGVKERYTCARVE